MSEVVTLPGQARAPTSQLDESPANDELRWDYRIVARALFREKGVRLRRPKQPRYDSSQPSGIGLVPSWRTLARSAGVAWRDDLGGGRTS